MITDGIRFNDKHSYADYGLYLSAPPNFGSPEPKIETVDIPGRDGVLDYSEAASGEIKYSNREMTFAFATMVEPERRDALMAEIRNDLHGKRVEVIYDLDPEWYYTGRASVSFEDISSWKMRVIVTVDAQPYKLSIDNTIITVEPTTFASEVVSLGQGTAAQGVNSIFTFGTIDAPKLDLTKYSKLTFVGASMGDVPYGEPNLQIVDSDSDAFNGLTGPNVLFDGMDAMDLAVSDITGIDKDSVYRILCQNRPMLSLYATTLSSTSIEIPVDRMSVTPVWTVSANCDVYVSGKKFSLTEGNNLIYDCRLYEGNNQVVFMSDADEVNISVTFQNGRL